MIPYDDLVRALDRYKRKQRGEMVTDESPHAGFAAGASQSGAEDVQIGDDVILESNDADYAQEVDLGDITNENPRIERDPGNQGTLFGMPGAPPPPPQGRNEP